MPTSERAEQLRAYVRQELEQLKAGEIAEVSTDAELAERFGYSSKDTAHNALARGTDLINQRRSIRREFQSWEVTPSEESAWMLGVLASSSVDMLPRSIRIGIHGKSTIEREKVFEKKFVPMAEGFFQVNAKIIERETNRGKKKTIQFNNASLIKALGNFNGAHWIKTIQENHNWLLQNQKYMWAFLSGYFERSGSINDILHAAKKPSISFRSTHQEVLNFLAESLVHLGTQRPLLYQYHGNFRLKIDNARDLKFVANHVHSIVPEREALLDEYRKLNVDKARSPHSATQEDALDAYSKLVERLGYEPTSDEIDTLRKQKLTRYSANLYRAKFGEGNFVKARENLRRILAERVAQATESSKEN